MDKDLQELLQQYIDGSISDVDKALIETELKQNSELQQDYQLLKDMETELGNQELMDFRSQVDGIMQNPVETNQKIENVKKISLPKKILSIAASLLILIAAGWWIINQNNSDSTNYIALADDYFTAYPAPNKARGDQPDTKIYEQYISKNYATASVELAQYGKAQNDNQANLYASISFIAIDQSDKAITLLNKLPLDNKVAYYLGIAYLKKGDKTNAMNAFQKVTNSDLFFFNKSKEILNKM